MILNVVKFLASLCMVIGMIGTAIGLGLFVTFVFLAADEPGFSDRYVNLAGASLVLAFICAAVCVGGAVLFVQRTNIEGEVEKG